MTINRQWIFASRPQGMVGPANFEYRETPLNDAPLQTGDVLVRNKTFSLIPAQRTWMNADSAYFPPIPIGAAVSAPATGEVVQSANPRFPVGTRVSGLTRWEDYSLIKADRLTISPLPADIDLLDALSVFGGNALTAYLGLLKIGEPKPGDTVVVSGAAGSTGSMAVQIARIVGCKAIGIAGGPAKCRHAVEDLGFAAAIDYKAEPVAERLAELTGEHGVDVYFDNVGGQILDDVLAHLAFGARVVICGAISQYESSGTWRGPANYWQLLVKRARMEGFLVLDFAKKFPAARAEMLKWLADGSLVPSGEVVDGSLEDFPAVLRRIFDGANIGKLILRI